MFSNTIQSAHTENQISSEIWKFRKCNYIFALSTYSKIGISSVIYPHQTRRQYHRTCFCHPKLQCAFDSFEYMELYRIIFMLLNNVQEGVALEWHIIIVIQVSELVQTSTIFYKDQERSQAEIMAVSCLARQTVRWADLVFRTLPSARPSVSVSP